MIRKILEEICTTATGMTGTEPINLAGKEMPSKYEKQGKPKQKKAQLGYKYMKIRRKKDNIVENLNLLEDLKKSSLFEAFSENLKEELASKILENVFNDKSYSMARKLLGGSSETQKNQTPSKSNSTQAPSKSVDIPDFLEVEQTKRNLAPLIARVKERTEALNQLGELRKKNENNIRNINKK